jgi:hypothetical protein
VFIYFVVEFAWVKVSALFAKLRLLLGETGFVIRFHLSLRPLLLRVPIFLGRLEETLGIYSSLGSLVTFLYRSHEGWEGFHALTMGADVFLDSDFMHQVVRPHDLFCVFLDT